MKKPDQQKIVKQLSSCLIEKYNGFMVIRIEYEKKKRKNFELLDIIYKLTKDLETEPLCYFTTDISFAYSAYYLRGCKMTRVKYSRAIIAITFSLITKRNLKGT